MCKKEEDIFWTNRAWEASDKSAFAEFLFNKFNDGEWYLFHSALDVASEDWDLGETNINPFNKSYEDWDNYLTVIWTNSDTNEEHKKQQNAETKYMNKLFREMEKTEWKNI